MAIDIQPDDEIITTPFTFIATAETIALLKAKPVLLISMRQRIILIQALLKQKSPQKPKRLCPFLSGQCADMDAINAIAAKHNLVVIEDACQSFGAEYKGSKSCNLSTIGCTSFFPSKPLGCYGDGGAIFCSDDALAAKIKSLLNHGQGKRYEHDTSVLMIA